jgi:hypothetical protein
LLDPTSALASGWAPASWADEELLQAAIRKREKKEEKEEREEREEKEEKEERARGAQGKRSCIPHE